MDPREIAKKLDSAIGMIAVAASGVVFVASASPLMIAVTAVAGVLVVKDLLKELKTEKTVRRLKDHGESVALLVRQLHEDEQLVLAIFIQDGQMTWAILGHADDAIHAKFESEGVLLTKEEVRSRADSGKYVIVGG